MGYAEKRRHDKLEERVCKHCGKVWLVRPRKHNGNKVSKRVLCPECSKNLTNAEKQLYYRLGQTKYHSEERCCLGCGKTWTVMVRNSKYTNKVYHFCNECNRTLTIQEKRRLRKSEDAEYAERCKEMSRQSHKRNIVRAMLRRAEQRALKYGYEFNLTVDDITIPKICPLLEVPIVLGDKDNYEYTPSLDRIDNSKGYIKGNVQIISKKANSMKNSASKEELITFAKNILRYSLNNDEKEIIESEDKEPQS